MLAPHDRRRRRVRRVIAVGLLFCALAIRIMPAEAQSAPNPAAFALPLSVFPPHSQIETSTVEPNSAISGDLGVDFNGSLEAAGRITGYYQVAAQVTADAAGASHGVLLLDRVSVFPSRAQALTAFSGQKAGWDQSAAASLGNVRSVTLPPGRYGEGNEEAAYVADAPTSNGIFDL